MRTGRVRGGMLALFSIFLLLAGTVPAMAQGQAKLTHRPVVFVHGYRADKGVWGGMEGYARSQGYRADELFRFDYSSLTPGSTSIKDLGTKLKEYIDQKNLVEKSPDGKVDIVAHSMGVWYRGPISSSGAPGKSRTW